MFNKSLLNSDLINCRDKTPITGSYYGFYYEIIEGCLGDLFSARIDERGGISGPFV